MYKGIVMHDSKLLLIILHTLSALVFLVLFHHVGRRMLSCAGFYQVTLGAFSQTVGQRTLSKHPVLSAPLLGALKAKCIFKCARQCYNPCYGKNPWDYTGRWDLGVYKKEHCEQPAH